VKFGEGRVKDSARLLLGHTKMIWENRVTANSRPSVFPNENVQAYRQDPGQDETDLSCIH